MVYNYFYIPLDSSCLNLAQGFYFQLYMSYWPPVFSFAVPLSVCEIKVILASLNELKSVSSSSLFQKRLCRILLTLPQKFERILNIGVTWTSFKNLTLFCFIVREFNFSPFRNTFHLPINLKFLSPAQTALRSSKLIYTTFPFDISTPIKTELLIPAHCAPTAYSPKVRKHCLGKSSYVHLTKPNSLRGSLTPSNTMSRLLPNSVALASKYVVKAAIFHNLHCDLPSLITIYSLRISTCLSLAALYTPTNNLTQQSE